MKLIFSEIAREKIRKLHPTIRRSIRACIETLRDNPYLGKALKKELEGYRSLVYNRYRIIYEVNEASKELFILTAGHREDVYELFAQQKKKN